MYVVQLSRKRVIAGAFDACLPHPAWTEQPYGVEQAQSCYIWESTSVSFVDFDS
jgi:hypothetical protein